MRRLAMVVAVVGGVFAVAVTSVNAFASSSEVVSSVGRAPVVAPFGDDQVLLGGQAGYSDAVRGVGPGMQAGADHVVGQQCPDGGWGWPHDDCSTTYNNITAPIAVGLLEAYASTSDPNHLAAAVAGGDFDLTAAFPNSTPSFGTHTPAFLHKLTGVSGDAGYSTFAETGFFDRLTAGTYGDASAACGGFPFPGDTYDYLNRHKCKRSGGLINLRPWDMQYMPWVAGFIGNADSTTPPDGISQQDTFRDLAILDGLGTLVKALDYDLLGLAGGTQGLALNGDTSFTAISNPTDFSDIDGISDLCDLVAVLLSFQNVDGSWSWRSDLQDTAGEQDTQTTAYAVLALLAAEAQGCGPYTTQIENGRDWLRSMQIPDGGYLSYPGGSENTEVEGEALTALIPDPCADDVLEFTLGSGSDCVQPGETVTVELHQGNLLQLVRGFQAFAQFDSGMMTHVSNTFETCLGTCPSDLLVPYGLVILDSVSGDDIDLAAGIDDMGSQLPTMTDALLVTLEFTAGATEGPTTVSFRSHEPPSRFSDEDANEVLPCLIPSPTIIIDGTDPIITCPVDTTIECDESTDPSNTGMATATDNLDPNPVITYSDVEDLSGCGGYTGTITRTWTATDCADNSSQCVQVITIVDNTDPTGTAPTDVTVQCDDVLPAAATNHAEIVAQGGTASDNCTEQADLVITHVDGPLVGGVCGGTIDRTYTIEDACGNAINVVQVITVDDTTPPDVADCPLDINVNADAGVCTAAVSWIAPTVTDNCDPSPSVVYDIDLGNDGSIDATIAVTTYTFPSGTHKVIVRATDACGNENVTCEFLVTVSSENELVVSIDLQAAVDPGPFDRCITFELWECGGPSSVTVEEVLTFTGGSASATVLVPCGDYQCITARDRLHTLRRTADPIGVVGTQYTADFTQANGKELTGGNLNDDFWIDILDFGVYSWQYATNYGSGDTDCTTPYPHADISGDGLANTGDFTFIQINFLQGHEDNCCDAPGLRDGENGPVTEISVRELHRRGLGHLSVADLDGNGRLDAGDVVAHAQGARPVSQAKSGRASRGGNR